MNILKKLDDVGFRIANLLITNPAGLSFTDIVRMTGRPKETVNKRLKRLVEYGLVEKEKHGRKTIYRISEKSKNIFSEIMITNRSLALFFTDFLKAFMDLVEEGHINEGYAFLCLFTHYIYITSYLRDYIKWLAEILEHHIAGLIESPKAPSFSEIGERVVKLMELVSFISPRELTVLAILPVTLAKATVDTLRRGYHPSRIFSELCNNEEGVERLWRSGLEHLSGRKYAKALGETLKRLESCKDECNRIIVIVDNYEERAKEFLTEAAALITRN